MDRVSTMHVVAAGVAGLYGLVCLIGGIIGYVKAGSLPSLVSGGPAGVLLLLCAFGVVRVPGWSMGGAIVVALAVLGFFGSKLIGNAGNLADYVHQAEGMRATGLAAGGLLVVVLSAIALAVGTRPPSAP